MAFSRVNGSKTQVAGWSTYTFLLWVIKAAMCCFYLRLTVCRTARLDRTLGFLTQSCRRGLSSRQGST